MKDILEYWWLISLIVGGVVLYLKWDVVQTWLGGNVRYSAPVSIAPATPRSVRVSKRQRADLVREEAGEALSELEALERALEREAVMTKSAIRAVRGHDASMYREALFDDSEENVLLSRFRERAPSQETNNKIDLDYAAIGKAMWSEFEKQQKTAKS